MVVGGVCRARSAEPASCRARLAVGAGGLLLSSSEKPVESFSQGLTSPSWRSENAALEITRGTGWGSRWGTPVTVKDGVWGGLPPKTLEVL